MYTKLKQLVRVALLSDKAVAYMSQELLGVKSDDSTLSDDQTMAMNIKK
jgi:hypothetical protein